MLAIVREIELHAQVILCLVVVVNHVRNKHGHVRAHNDVHWLHVSGVHPEELGCFGG